jgi:cell wall-associated NlpC family hydrolase
VSKIDAERCYKECRQLVSQTKYKRYSKQEDAPFETNCLTAIRHLFTKIASIDIPRDWIGNMPRSLVNRKKWSIQQITASELQPGDLLFLRNTHAKRLITHVAVALSPDEVFHSSRGAKGGRIEKIADIFSKYAQPKNSQELLTYVDPRTELSPSMEELAYSIEK